MTTIRITDVDDDGCLAFDLRDLLDLIGEEAVECRWLCAVESVVPKEGVNYLGRAFAGEHSSDGAVLFQLANNTLQIPEGTFRAFQPGNDSPWITLEAFDSTWWEVSSDDTTLLESISRRFRSVEIRAGK